MFELTKSTMSKHEGGLEISKRQFLDILSICGAGSAMDARANKLLTYISDGLDVETATAKLLTDMAAAIEKAHHTAYVSPDKHAEKSVYYAAAKIWHEDYPSFWSSDITAAYNLAAQNPAIIPYGSFSTSFFYIVMKNYAKYRMAVLAAYREAEDLKQKKQVEADRIASRIQELDKSIADTVAALFLENKRYEAADELPSHFLTQSVAGILKSRGLLNPAQSEWDDFKRANLCKYPTNEKMAREFIRVQLWAKIAKFSGKSAKAKNTNLVLSAAHFQAENLRDFLALCFDANTAKNMMNFFHTYAIAAPFPNYQPSELDELSSEVLAHIKYQSVVNLDSRLLFDAINQVSNPFELRVEHISAQTLSDFIQTCFYRPAVANELLAYANDQIANADGYGLDANMLLMLLKCNPPARLNKFYFKRKISELIKSRIDQI